jgi:hypothetical protein
MEGASINSTVRMTGVSKPTILKLIADLGIACAAFHDVKVRNVQTRRVQVDEIWAFVYEKQKKFVRAKKAPEGAGDTWTWTAIDADSKLIVAISSEIAMASAPCGSWTILRNGCPIVSS